MTFSILFGRRYHHPDCKSLNNIILDGWQCSLPEFMDGLTLIPALVTEIPDAKIDFLRDLSIISHFHYEYAPQYTPYGLIRDGIASMADMQWKYAAWLDYVISALPYRCLSYFAFSQELAPARAIWQPVHQPVAR